MEHQARDKEKETDMQRQKCVWKTDLYCVDLTFALHTDATVQQTVNVSSVQSVHVEKGFLKRTST